jgi:hypothetical protein
MGRKTVEEIGLKITASQREYFRYTGPSAELERRGAGTSRPELAWVRRQKREKEQRHENDAEQAPKRDL